MPAFDATKEIEQAKNQVCYNNEPVAIDAVYSKPASKPMLKQTKAESLKRIVKMR